MKQHLKQMLTLGSFYSVSSFLEKSLGFLLIPVYTAYLTPRDYGIIGLLTVTISWIEKLASAPVGNGITRYYHSPEFSANRRQLVFSGYAFVAAQVSILTLLFYLFSEPLTRVLLGDETLASITRAFAVVLLVHPLGGLMGSLLRIQGRARYFAVVNFFRFALTGLLQVYLLVWHQVGVMAMVYGSIFAAWFDVLAIAPAVKKDLAFKFNWTVLKPVLHYGYPLIVAALALALSSTADRYALRAFGSLDAVGLYSLAFTLAGVMTVLFKTPLKQAFLPVVFGMEKDPDYQRAFVARSCTYAYAAGVLLWLAVALFSKELVLLLARNPAFRGAYTAIPFLAFAEMQAGMVSYFGSGMAMAKRSGLISATSVFRLAVNAALLILLVPAFGVIGAALAAMAGQCALNFVRARYSRKLYDQRFEVRRLLGITLVGWALFAGDWLVLTAELPYWSQFCLKVLFLLLYPLAIWHGGVFGPEHRAELRAMLGPVRRLSRRWFGRRADTPVRRG